MALNFIVMVTFVFVIASQETDVFHFEMDESQLSNVLSSIEEIEKKLTSYAQ